MRGKFWNLKRRLIRFVPKRYVIWKGREGSKAVAFTFDDGPHPEYTEKLLSLLNRYQIKATFFPSGKNLKRYPEIARKIVQHGHLIGGHTFAHKKLTEMSLKELGSDLRINKRTIIETTGNNFRYLRPPYGELSAMSVIFYILRGITIVLWSLDSRDFEHNSKINIFDNVIGDGVRGGDVILFHDNNEFTLEALPKIINDIEEKGYRFVTIDEFIK